MLTYGFVYFVSLFLFSLWIFESLVVHWLPVLLACLASMFTGMLAHVECWEKGILGDTLL